MKWKRTRASIVSEKWRQSRYPDISNALAVSKQWKVGALQVTIRRNGFDFSRSEDAREHLAGHPEVRANITKIALPYPLSCFMAPSIANNFNSCPHLADVTFDMTYTERLALRRRDIHPTPLPGILPATLPTMLPTAPRPALGTSDVAFRKLSRLRGLSRLTIDIGGDCD